MAEPIEYRILHRNLETNFDKLTAALPHRIENADQETIKKLLAAELQTALADFDTLALTIAGMTTGEGAP